MKWLILGSAKIWTRVTGFWVQCPEKKFWNEVDTSNTLHRVFQGKIGAIKNEFIKIQNLVFCSFSTFPHLAASYCSTRIEIFKFFLLLK